MASQQHDVPRLVVNAPDRSEYYRFNGLLNKLKPILEPYIRTFIEQQVQDAAHEAFSIPSRDKVLALLENDTSVIEEDRKAMSQAILKIYDSQPQSSHTRDPLDWVIERQTGTFANSICGAIFRIWHLGARQGGQSLNKSLLPIDISDEQQQLWEESIKPHEHLDVQLDSILEEWGSQILQDELDLPGNIVLRREDDQIHLKVS